MGVERKRLAHRPKGTLSWGSGGTRGIGRMLLHLWPYLHTPPALHGLRETRIQTVSLLALPRHPPPGRTSWPHLLPGALGWLG